MKRIVSSHVASAEVDRRIDNSAYDVISIAVANIASIIAVSDDIENVNIVAALEATLASIVADKDTLDSIYIDKPTLDSIFADKAELDAVYAELTAIINLDDNMAAIQSLDTNMSSIIAAEVNAQFIKDAMDLMHEPTGYDRYDNPDQLGVIELCLQDPLDNTKYYIHGIDQNGANIAVRHELKTAALWGNGDAINAAITHQFAQYPVDEVTPITWWINGTMYTRDTIEILTIIPASGLHYFYRDTIELKQTITFTSDLYDKHAYTSAIYGNAGTGEKVMFADERHAVTMDGSTHKYISMTHGTQYVSGFGIVGLAAGSGVYTQLDSGRYFDADIDMITSIQTNSPFWHISGSVWRGVADGVNLAYITGTRPNYNLDTAGTWSVEEIAIGKYALIHLYATNDAEFPIVKVLGQNEYANSSDARDGALNELKELTLVGLPSTEYFPLYTIILDASGDLVLTSEGELYVDWRSVDISSTQGSGDTLPSQAGNGDKFLQTNGTIPAWIDIDAFLGTEYEGL